MGGIAGISAGIVGIGGTSGDTAATFLLGETARPGDGLRKVRSVIDPAEPLRCSWLLGLPALGPLPVEDVDPFLAMRLVWMSPTSTGVEGCERRAVAAAAAERVAFDCWFFIKACEAAAAADAVGVGIVVEECGCSSSSNVSSILMRSTSGVEEGNVRFTRTIRT